MPFTFWATSTHSWGILHFSFTDISKSFSTKLLFIYSSPNLYECLRFPRSRYRIIADGPIESHELHGSRSLCVASLPSSVTAALLSSVLSTNLLSALNLIVIDVKQYQLQYRPQRDIICHWISSSSLNMVIQPIPYQWGPILQINAPLLFRGRTVWSHCTIRSRGHQLFFLYPPML